MDDDVELCQGIPEPLRDKLVVSLAVGMRLRIEETDQLLQYCGKVTTIDTWRPSMQKCFVHWSPTLASLYSTEELVELASVV